MSSSLLAAVEHCVEFSRFRRRPAPLAKTFDAQRNNPGALRKGDHVADAHRPARLVEGEASGAAQAADAAALDDARGERGS